MNRKRRYRQLLKEIRSPYDLPTPPPPKAKREPALRVPSDGTCIPPYVWHERARCQSFLDSLPDVNLSANPGKEKP